MSTNALTEWPRHPGYREADRKGFFTDTSICIGCKACEVACKIWNRNPVEEFKLSGNSYDNTGALGADTWRHVAFVEQTQDRIVKAKASGKRLVGLGMPHMPGKADGQAEEQAAAARLAERSEGQESDSIADVPSDPAELISDCAASGPGSATGPGTATSPESAANSGTSMSGVRRESTGLRPGSPLAAAANGDLTPPDTPDFRWLMSSDVCKHCTNAGCLDVCPTGALFRTEFGTVVVQDDVCNGCGTCVAGCPFGVIERRKDGGVRLKNERTGQDFTPGEKAPARNIGVAQKCTLCYDRLKSGEMPACAKACPTNSIQFGSREEMLERARARVAELREQGMTEARLYGANSADGVGGTGSIFLLLDEPEVYGLPPDPKVPTTDLPKMAKTALKAAAGMVGAACAAFLLGGK